ncbi:MAG: L,D-transpeptidase [Thermoleophilia bacterium]|nr:L,D-transpeptidase [Thermoleophilia bacterium]
MRRWFGTVAVCTTLLAWAPQAWPAGVPAVPRHGALTALVVWPTVARAAPDRDARPLMRLTGATAYSRRPQAMLVTGVRHAGTATWVRVQLPIRPNGTAGWVRRRTVRLRVTRVRLVVRLASRRLEVWRSGRRVASFAAGVGRPGTPTPVGRFAVQDALPTLPAWRRVYGGWTIPLTAHSPTLRRFMGGDGLVALHGGGSWRVGARSSNGCVVLGEGDLAVVARLVRPGTPVDIRRS